MRNSVRAIVFVSSIITGIISIIIFCAIPTYCSLKWQANCGEWLQQASNANSASIGLERLTNAINYLESNKITQGSSHIIYATPNTNVEIWYQNLKAAQKQLQDSVNNKNLSNLEESNILMKLRETLTEKDAVIVPENIVYYPNGFMFLFGSLFFVCLSAIIFMVVLIQ